MIAAKICRLAVGVTLALVMRLFALDPAAMQSIVIVEGESGGGRGSAFLLKADGRTYVVTNAHVIQGHDDNLVFKNLRNETLRLGTFEIADSADLVRAEVAGDSPALQSMAQIERTLKIGDEVVVAGNSEGAGVVRELPGKVTGLGPDRIEVDATFVPGNSGSPIVERASGRVVGVATYLHTPWLFRRKSSTSGKKEEPILSLNEVRRFGYRLDTVREWVRSAQPDGLIAEGRRLQELADMDSVVRLVMFAGTSSVASLGSSAFIKAEWKTKSARFRTLAEAIDEFATQYRKATEPEQKRAPFLRLIEQLKAATTEDARELNAGNFSGYFAKLFEEKLERRKSIHEWLDFQSQQAEKNAWVLRAPWSGDEAAVVDVAKLNLPLSLKLDATATVDAQRVVSYPPESKPESLRNIYWVIENPGGKSRAIEMHVPNLRVVTPANGTYRVSAEYRAGEATRRISNVVEFTVTGLPAPNVEVDFEKEPPLPIAAGEAPAPPDWPELASRVSREQFVKTRILGHDHPARAIRDIPENGGVLIGFDCVLEPFRRSNEIVHGLRPIFLTAKGPIAGTQWGDRTGRSTFRLEARPGYAVGRVTGQFDSMALRCLKVRFDRICGMKLDPQDSYESAWIGAFADAEEQSADTNGRLAVGIVGKHGGGLDGLRLVCLADGIRASLTSAPPAAAGAFASLNDLIALVPAGQWADAEDDEKRAAAAKQINATFTAKAKGKPATFQVKVERVEAVESPPNRLRIKAADRRVPATRRIVSRIWIYFPAESVPPDEVQIGSDITVTGRLSRCELVGAKGASLNIDLQNARVVQPASPATPGAIPSDRDSGARPN